MFDLLNKESLLGHRFSDEVDTNRLKTIDGTTTWIDFGKPPNDSKTFFEVK